MLPIFFVAGLVGGPGTLFDDTVSRAASDSRISAPGLTVAAAYFTELGGARFTLGAAVFAALWLLLRRQPVVAVILLMTVAAERRLVDWLKDLSARPRPLLGAVDTGSLAFPSGHAANSMTAYLAIALLAVPSAYRAQAAVLAISLSLLLGLSRIYLGVHWPSDVIGGWALGLLAAGSAVTVAGLKSQHEVVGGHQPPLSKGEPS